MADDSTFTTAELDAATNIYVQVSVDGTPDFITLTQLQTLLAAL